MMQNDNVDYKNDADVEPNDITKTHLHNIWLMPARQLSRSQWLVAQPD